MNVVSYVSGVWTILWGKLSAARFTSYENVWAGFNGGLSGTDQSKFEQKFLCETSRLSSFPFHFVSEVNQLLLLKHMGSDFLLLFFVKLRKELTSEADSVVAALRGITVDSSPSPADLTQLFRIANHEAKKSRALNRIYRVVSNQKLTLLIFGAHNHYDVEQDNLSVNIKFGCQGSVWKSLLPYFEHINRVIFVGTSS